MLKVFLVQVSPTCSKCPQCCPKFGCRGQVTEVLAGMAHSGCESKGGFNFDRGIHATLQNQTTSDPVPLSVYGPSFRSSHSSSGIYQGSQGGEADGSSTGYPDPPVPRRLVSQSPVPGNLPTAYPDPLGHVPRTRVGGKHEKIGTYTSTGFQFRRLPVRSTVRSGFTHSGQVDHSSAETTVHQRQEKLLSQTVHVSMGLLTATEKQVWAGRLHMRPVQWHLKRHWHIPESLEKIIPIPLSLHPHLDWWLEENNVLKGQSLHPLQHALQIFTDASNEGWGAHLGGSTARGVWSEPESRLHINFLELKAVLLALKSFEHRWREQIVLIATDNTTVVSYINKEGGMRSGSLCALLWRLLSWCHPRKVVLRARHIPGRLNVIADKLSRHNQVIQTEWSLSPQVFHLLCSKWARPQIDLFATRFNHRLPKFVSPVPDQAAWAVDILSLGKSGRVCLSFSLPSQSSRVKARGSGLSQDDPGRSRVAQHALVLGSGQSVESDSFQSSLGEGPVNPTIQRSPPQEPGSSKSACLAPRASSIHKQGFSDEVAARIEAPQSSSTRAVYKSKWAIFVKWCESNEVDFRSPSLKQVADFLLYLFKERHLQPSTLEGYSHC